MPSCTASLVFTGSDGGTCLGYAAHCARSDGGSQAADCTTPTYPLGTAVTIVAAPRS